MELLIDTPQKHKTTNKRIEEVESREYVIDQSSDLVQNKSIMEDLIDQFEKEGGQKVL
jgi:hypothetical protein